MGSEWVRYWEEFSLSIAKDSLWRIVMEGTLTPGVDVYVRFCVNHTWAVESRVSLATYN